ncbi:MAG: LON peptidase substrate-binding domain-containing protein, partial [Spirochaetes bacterium]|nr:LON peptidase substrate-binding domain-containing protein [Spirochaetota bacterium]
MKKRNIDFDKSLPLLPLRDVIVFPHMVIPLFVGREKSVKALDAAMKGDRLIVLATQINAQESTPVKEGIYEVGTVSEILQLLKLPDGTIKILVEGLARAYISEYKESGSDYFEVAIKNIERPIAVDSEIAALKRMVLKAFEKYVKLNKKVPWEAFITVSGIEDPSHLSDAVTSYVQMAIDYKQSLLG